MLKKENRGFFNICCGSGLTDSQIHNPPPKMTYYRSNKQGKHSLKNISNRSSVLSSQEIKQVPSKHNHKLFLINQDSTLNHKNIRQLQIQSNATSNYRINQKEILQQKKSCNFNVNYATRQGIPINSTKKLETKSIYEQLQKTTRKYTLIPKTPQILPQLLLQQTKQTCGSMMLMTLGRFKESLISVYIQNDQPPRIDESIIMIDYFHPTNHKHQENTSFLHRRQ